MFGRLVPISSPEKGSRLNTRSPSIYTSKVVSPFLFQFVHYMETYLFIECEAMAGACCAAGGIYTKGDIHSACCRS